LSLLQGPAELSPDGKRLVVGPPSWQEASQKSWEKRRVTLAAKAAGKAQINKGANGRKNIAKEVWRTHLALEGVIVLRMKTRGELRNEIVDSATAQK